MKPHFILLLLSILFVSVFASSPGIAGKKEKSSPVAIVTGAAQVNRYLPYLKGKRVGMLVNQTSVIGKNLVVDSLVSLGIKVKVIFGPEHGFRGNASNGAAVKDEVDEKTGIPVVSLYGAKSKPSKEDMAAIDVLVFDIQDVGCRFYTIINTLARAMEACAENNKEMIILDRPNPNAYVDGPVLDMRFKSGIGKFPIPVTHGMTIGEFARMVNGEGWLPNKMKCRLKIIPVKNYRHDMYYELPVAPSPNLNTQTSIMLYPSLCLFEGTIISQGRGTYTPFAVLGAPLLVGKYDFSFTPVSIKGMSEEPLHKDKTCYGIDLRNYDVKAFHAAGRINLGWMIELYNAYPEKERFFDSSQSKAMGKIENLIGNDQFRNQIAKGMSEEEIRKTWEPGLSRYKQMRKKYLLYK